jgi:hypothetical protein
MPPKRRGRPVSGAHGLQNLKRKIEKDYSQAEIERRALRNWVERLDRERADLRFQIYGREERFAPPLSEWENKKLNDKLEELDQERSLVRDEEKRQVDLENDAYIKLHLKRPFGPPEKKK